jgi:hypothetical protein
MYFHHAAAEQETLPMSAVAFRHYLETYQIEPLDVALRSGVRYLIVWRVKQGQPIKSQDELRILQGLLRMTGIPYTAPLLVHAEHTERKHEGKTTPPETREWK